MSTEAPTAARCAERRNRLKPTLQERGLAALLVAYPANRYYLSGFELADGQCNESSGCVLVLADAGAEDDWLLTDPRFSLDAEERFGAERVHVYSGKRMDKIAAFLKDRVTGPLGVEQDTIGLADYQALTALEGLAVEPVSGLVEGLRRTKDAEEVEALRASCRLNHQLMEALPGLLTPGRTEAEVAWDIERFFREHGATQMAFSSIVAVGPGGAMPHYTPGPVTLTDNCPVLVDTGARFAGYCSDQTRTFWVGDRPSEVFQKTKELVVEAQARGIEKMRPGAAIKDAFRAARDFFAGHSVAEHFTHSLGHGIGLETHEAPSVGPRTEAAFEPGMVVTAEPGLYYPEWGGVRWEHMVLITEDGNEVL